MSNEMSCSGPCLEHCACPNWILFSSFACVTYVVSCVWYLIETRRERTPLHDSLTLYQRYLKRKSARKRWRVFERGLIVGIIASLFIHKKYVGRLKFLEKYSSFKECLKS